ncbi:CehA/McbA family metallohydrolase [Deltaproteobacteria bacterium]|nr:CehA/McbA family metallohydrolase [Deltaproteobacteria bacterium]
MFNHEYLGNVHIHSIHSDGGKNYAEIAGEAARAGLQFIIFNDHDYLKSNLNLDNEGFYGNLLVLIGLEIGRQYHHYLAYDLKDMAKSDNLEPQGVIDEVNKQGGFGFLAHPFEKGMPFYEKSTAYTWKDLSVTGFTGICIWNFASRFKERIKTIFHGLFFLSFKNQTLKGPSRKTMTFWDELCQQRRVGAIGGSDAHGSLFRWGPINIMPLSYDFLLRAINIHVLLNRKINKDFKNAKHDIYDAMREGRLFIANDRIFPSRGFKFYFISDDGSDLLMGEEDNFQTGNLVVELPDKGEIRLVKDGDRVHSWRGMEAVYRVTEKGVYRVEVYRRIPFFGWRPWIFTNPIYLR